MRRGVTLLEILICILIASVALLGILALISVATSQAKRGQTADITGVAGESAIAAFKAERMQEPARWLYWDATNSATAFVPPDFQQSTSPFFGFAFCIDPHGFEHNRIEDATGANAARWSRFPAVPAAAAPNGNRMVRLTLHNGNPTLPNDPAQRMSFLQADKVFRIEDELIYDRPDDNSLPARQLYTQSSGNAGRRQEEGRTTWFATLVPKFGPRFTVDAAGNTVLNDPKNPLGDEYVLSIVVCRNRSGESLHIPDAAGTHPWPEWTAEILPGDFHASGTSGGEVTVTTSATFNQPQYLDLRSGAWVMLTRLIPSAAGPVQHAQWYRVSSADEARANGNRWSQDVTLIGPDWPCDVQAPAGVNEPADVVLMPAVIHVYERTMRLK